MKAADKLSRNLLHHRFSKKRKKKAGSVAQFCLAARGALCTGLRLSFSLTRAWANTASAELRALMKKGRLSSGAALDAIERERTELAFQASRDERRVYEEAMKVIPQSAALYRAAVHDLKCPLR